MADCAHHWVLNDTNHGVCKRCGAERQFSPPYYADKWGGAPMVVPKRQPVQRRDRDRVLAEEV